MLSFKFRPASHEVLVFSPQTCPYVLYEYQSSVCIHISSNRLLQGVVLFTRCECVLFDVYKDGELTKIDGRRGHGAGSKGQLLLEGESLLLLRRESQLL